MVSSRRMTEQDPPQRGTAKSGADQTLLGVAPPRVDSSADSPQRSPVFVRSGTSVADVDPPPLPRMASKCSPTRPANRQEVAVRCTNMRLTTAPSANVTHEPISTYQVKAIFV